MDLPSSGDASLIIPQVPCEFGADQPTFIFQGKFSRGQRSFQGGGGVDLPSSGVMPSPWPRSPVSFEPISQTSVFQGKYSQGSADPMEGKLS